MKRPDIGDTFTNGIDNITDDRTGQIKDHSVYLSDRRGSAAVVEL